MELIVGTNTYFTQEECEEIIASNFMSTDSKRIFWNNLPKEDKEILIVSTHKKIDKDEKNTITQKQIYDDIQLKTAIDSIKVLNIK